MSSTLTRRSLGRLLGATAGAAILDARFPGRLSAATLPSHAAGGPIRLSANENPYGPCQASLDAFARSSSEANRYPGAIEDEMKAALAKHHGVPEDRIVLGCGSSDILRMADSAFVPEGKTVVVAEPTFEAVLLYCKATKGEPVKVPQTTDYRHDLVGMAAACGAATGKTGMVYVCNPNNPTGTIVGAQELEAFVRRVPPSCVVLVDEAYHHFVESPSYKSAIELIGRHDNVVVARTFSKIYGMAGMRLGYAVASPARAQALQSHSSWNNTSQSGLAMGLAALADPDVVADQRRRINDARRWLCAELVRDNRKFIPSETNFVMIHVGGDIGPVAHAMRERGIQVGRKFPSMPDWLRVSIGKPEDMKAFVAALRQIVPAKAA
ncbi:MAG TPA: aminotransferase class I/II-fold pyridoxal phosphate-dependent enzyme [Thermoanaerobaculia bacterium]